MLKSLYIENVAVIEKVLINFSEGLNVMTGETGAGKSIVIDSINAILGQRTPRDLVRTGAKSAIICGEFDNITDELKKIISDLGYSIDDNEPLIIQREINISGKGNCRINGRPATIAALKEIGINLINIHGQHESYELMSTDLHINYIDRFGELQGDIDEYLKYYQEYKTYDNKLNKSKSDEAERERKIDLLRYQIEELSNADITVGELEELTERKRIILNSEKIALNLEHAKAYLNGDDEIQGVISNLEETANALQNITEYLKDIDNIYTRINDAVYELQDCYSEICSYIDDIDFNQNELDDIEQRLDVLYRLGKKYGETEQEMLDFLQDAISELDELENYETNLENLKSQRNQALLKAQTLALKISEKRKNISEIFTERVKEEMSFLDMPNIQLVVNQTTCELNKLGCDSIEFLISTNLGEPPKPISKIASGGELSRMMLAIKNVLSNKDNVDTLIFDEVDTGISGSAAQKVGLKLKEVSRTKQVLCVTHLAQISALGDAHYLIKKNVENDRTFTKVEKLDYEGRKYEIARIIGGVQITDITLNHADEMLKMGLE